ncbi:MAG TPA: GDSL-type esterase/lipase family protein [Mucilaginibacter sp.]|jgi:lysophospholipase L1-like esterase|nr:GDSL-type esterase/lipase family protein [Mucilaginibacter sp.]
MFWYEDEVKRIEQEGSRIKYQPEIIFYGSSSIRLWTGIYNDFKDMKPINLGFGGSTLAACVWFFERVMASYQPKRFVIYAGDNDLGDGRHPEEIFIFFQELVVRVNKRFGNIPCYFISLKPSPARRGQLDQYKFTNMIISREIAAYDNNWKFIDVYGKMIDPQGNPRGKYFADDGLHLSMDGYRLWKQVIGDFIHVNP